MKNDHLAMVILFLCDSGGINPYLDYQALRREFATCWNAVAK
jgi:hypothetical protein